MGVRDRRQPIEVKNILSRKQREEARTMVAQLVVVKALAAGVNQGI